MDLPVEKESSKEFWLRHIQAAEAFEGTIKEYCRINGLNPGSMSGNRRRLGFSKKRGSKSSTKSQFSTVKVVDSVTKKGADLPDPR